MFHFKDYCSQIKRQKENGIFRGHAIKFFVKIARLQLWNYVANLLNYTTAPNNLPFSPYFFQLPINHENVILTGRVHDYN